MRITRVGDFTLGWGESLVWDDQRGRLYFVDCAARALHWLDGDGGEELCTLPQPSMPAGVVPTTEGLLVVALHDGLYLVDPDDGTTGLLARYPDEMGGRANDACADLDGNLITGKLNLGPGEGAAWWYSPRRGWRMLDPDITNTNGPAAGVLGGEMTLVIGDTSAHYYAYPYEPAEGSLGPRRVFGDMTGLDGGPDGSTLDAHGGLWCALYGGGQLARFTAAGLDRTLALPAENPTDVTFGGPGLDRLYVVSVAAGPDAGGDGLDGALLVIDGLELTGRPEPRFSLA
jgi:sugar lactone lactonase YvrE